MTGQEDDAININFILDGGYELDKSKTTKQIKK
jgi:hypothetical protein